MGLYSNSKVVLQATLSPSSDFKTYNIQYNIQYNVSTSLLNCMLFVTIAT